MTYGDNDTSNETVDCDVDGQESDVEYNGSDIAMKNVGNRRNGKSQSVTVHKELTKKYRCSHDNCSKAFSIELVMMSNLEWHTTGVFICPYSNCDKEFVTESQLSKHLHYHMRKNRRTVGDSHAIGRDVSIGTRIWVPAIDTSLSNTRPTHRPFTSSAHLPDAIKCLKP